MDSIYILKSYRESKREKQEGDDRGWDAWTASPTRWTWVWVNSGSWWWTGRPGMLRFMRSQRVGHNQVTELNWEGKRGKTDKWKEWEQNLNPVSNQLTFNAKSPPLPSEKFLGTTANNTKSTWMFLRYANILPLEPVHCNWLTELLHFVAGPRQEQGKQSMPHSMPGAWVLQNWNQGLCSAVWPPKDKHTGKDDHWVCL